jgi:hypothetical protein
MDEHTGEIGGNEPNAPAKWKFSIDATSWEATFFAAVTPNTYNPKLVIEAARKAVATEPDKKKREQALATFEENFAAPSLTSASPVKDGWFSPTRTGTATPLP